MKLFIPHLSCSFVSVHLISMRHELFPRREVRGGGEFTAMTQKDVDLELEMGLVGMEKCVCGMGDVGSGRRNGPSRWGARTQVRYWPNQRLWNNSVGDRSPWMCSRG